jgi:hypothetical protein
MKKNARSAKLPTEGRLEGACGDGRTETLCRSKTRWAVATPMEVGNGGNVPGAFSLSVCSEQLGLEHVRCTAVSYDVTGVGS